MGLQETWRTGVEEITQDGYTFLGVAPMRQDSRRGVCGVGLLLSPMAAAAWRAAGPTNLHTDVGPRVMAARLVVEDMERRQLGIFQVVAYAPASGAAVEEHDAYEAAFSEVIARRKPEDVLIVCADTNASIGRGRLNGSPSERYSAVGPHGIDHMNGAGRRLRSFLELHDLAALTSFFQKPYYGTWQHPRSKLQHQLDHIIISRKDLKRFTDAGGCSGQLIDSDHRAVRCTLRFAVRLKHQCDVRARVCKLDFSPLLIHDIGTDFSKKVVALLDPPIPGESYYPALADALRRTAITTLPKRARAAPAWFAAKETELLSIISRRSEAFHAHQREPSLSTRERYRSARASVQREIRRAKSAWIEEKCGVVNDGFNGSSGGKVAWDTVKLLKAGLTPPRRAPQAKLKRRDGSMASTPEDVADVFAEHFSELYGRAPLFDESVLNMVEPLPVVSDEGTPSDTEIHGALRKLHATAPGASGLHARLWKAFSSTDEGFDHVRHCVLHFWATEHVPAAWEVGLLSILPKKGDLSKPGNYRGIMMQEVFYKIIGNIILGRLKPIKEGPLDHEYQNGFRPFRGCFDSIFTVRQVIKKRREHGLPTWLLLIDLVKAFDRVPRELLWRTMEKQGVPPKLIHLLRVLHETVKVQFEVDGAAKVIDSIIGVKQGDLLGPELFTFFMEAVMKTWRCDPDTHYEPCLFRTAPDLQMTGRRINQSGEDFVVPDSEYADDTAVIFQTREDVERMTPKLIHHFARWGMEVHVGSADNKTSKSEVLFCAAAPASYEDPGSYDGIDLSNIRMSGGRFMPVVEIFKYLGSYLSRDSSDAYDVDSRIESAGKAFGSLRKCLFASDSVSPSAKRAVYKAVILSILLYGCECWSLT